MTLTPIEEDKLAEAVKELRKVEQTISTASMDLAGLLSDAKTATFTVMQLCPAVHTEGAKTFEQAEKALYALNGADIGGLMIRCGRLCEDAWEKRESPYP